MLFSRQALIRLFIPLIIEQLLAICIGMADTVMVTSVSESAVSAVSLVDSINVLLIQLFSAMATGGAIVAAQYLGRKDTENACKAAKQLMYSSVIIALVIGLVAVIFCRPILQMCFGSLAPSTMAYCETYLLLSAVSYPALAAYNAGAALLRAMGNSKASMFTSLLMNLTNVIGNAILIYGFRMEVAGAATASLVSRILGAAIMLRMMLNTHAPIHIKRITRPEFNFPMIRLIFRQGIPNGLENSMFQVGKLLVAGIVSQFGESIIAANAIGNTVTTFFQLPGSAIGLGMVTVVGQCIGAGKKEQARYYTKRLVVLVWLLLFISDGLLFFFIPNLAPLFNLSPEAVSASVEVLRLYAVMATFFWALSFTLPNALRAAGDSRFTMMVSIIAMWAVRVGLSYFFVYNMGMKLTGVWLAMCLDWIVRAAAFFWRYLSGKWLHQKVIDM